MEVKVDSSINVPTKKKHTHTHTDNMQHSSGGSWSCSLGAFINGRTGGHKEINFSFFIFI